MAVSACFITRNHAHTLGRAIRSVAGLAQEVLVGDTGSTDRTTEVAGERGARLIPISWADDFSAACNTVISAATGDWILWLNPDEELEASAIPLLNDAAADPNVFAWQLRVRQETSADRPGEGLLGWEFRLYRRDVAVRYQGRLHPNFLTPLPVIAANRNQPVAAVDAVIRRHAYLSTPTPDRMRWVVRLLEAELRDRPGQVGYLIELGRNLLWLNDPRGHEVLDQAAELVKQAGGNPHPPSDWVGSLIEYLLTVSPEQSRSAIDRAEVRDWAARWFPNTPPVVWAVAGERFASGKYAAAAGLLERLVQMGRTGDYETAGGFNPNIIGSNARQNLGLCYLHLGRWDAARACFLELMNDPVCRNAALLGFQLAERRERPAR